MHLVYQWEDVFRGQEVGWASLVAQIVKNLPPKQETLVKSLGQEDPLEKGVATHSSILIWESHGQRSLAAIVHGAAESDMTEQLTHVLSH